MENVVKITINQLANEMNNGIVKFSYIKKDGTHRLAYGTRNTAELNNRNVVTGDGKVSPKVFAYYDIEAEGWRCFSRELNEKVPLFKAA